MKPSFLSNLYPQKILRAILHNPSSIYKEIARSFPDVNKNVKNTWTPRTII